MSLINLMPMSGRGQRFNNYCSIPKPFIKINEKPMFALSYLSMPKAEKNIFLYLKDHKELFKKNIKYISRLKNIISVEIDKTTEGQASTCLLADNYICNNDQIFIHSCDSYFEFNKSIFKKLIKKNDIIVFTTEPTQYHLENINSFGWINFKDGKISNITCKKNASNSPKKDKIIIGSFAFRNKKIFLDSINYIISKKIKINGEYYLDMALIQAFKNQTKISAINVNNYNSWGTPDEIKKFENNFTIRNNKIISNI